jgi:hypothetical protein
LRQQKSRIGAAFLFRKNLLLLHAKVVLFYFFGEGREGSGDSRSFHVTATFLFTFSFFVFAMGISFFRGARFG